MMNVKFNVQDVKMQKMKDMNNNQECNGTCESCTCKINQEDG